MRIEEEFIKSGYFWLPENEADKIPGVMTIKDGGKIELEVVGLFHNRLITQNESIKRIIGHIEDEGLVTLDGCFYTKQTMGGIAKSTVYVATVFCGVAYDTDELVLFNSLSFSVDCLDEWVGISGIKVDYADDYRTATIGYAPPEVLKYELDNGLSLEILFSYTLPGFSNGTEAKISQKAYFKLTSEQPIPYRNLTEVAFKLDSFLCFAMDETVALKNLVGKSTEIVDRNENEVPIKVFYQSIPFESREPKKDWHQMLFTYNAIRENAELVINNWLAAYETVDPALNLYFATKTGAQKYTDGKFLALAQGLETYHRRTSSETLMDQSEFDSLVQQIIQGCPEEHSEWLKGRLIHGNEINLGKRIKAIIEPFKDKLGNNRERSKLLRNIVNTRNYLTHYSDSLEEHALNGAELWKLCQKMEAIFQLHFLKVIGFNESEIGSVIESCHFLNQKLSR